MVSDLNDWLKERRRIHDAATEGPWESHGTTAATAWSGAGDYSGPVDDREPVANASPEDVSAIVDAHSTLPALLTAAENVLELHTETVHGECSICFECTYNDGYEVDYSPYDYPCPTVRSIETATQGDDNA